MTLELSHRSTPEDVAGESDAAAEGDGFRVYESGEIGELDTESGGGGGEDAAGNVISRGSRRGDGHRGDVCAVDGGQAGGVPAAMRARAAMAVPELICSATWTVLPLVLGRRVRPSSPAYPARPVTSWPLLMMPQPIPVLTVT